MTVRPCAALRDGGCAPSGRKWRMHRTDRRLALQPAGGRLREMRRGRRRRRRGKGRDRGQAEQGAGVTAGCQHRLQPCFCATSLMRCSHQLARDLPRLALPCPSLRCCVLRCCARCCFDFPVTCWCIILLVLHLLLNRTRAGIINYRARARVCVCVRACVRVCVCACVSVLRQKQRQANSVLDAKEHPVHQTVITD